MAPKRRKGKARKSRPATARKNCQSKNVDVVEGPGIRLERQGRIIHSSTDRTPEEQLEVNKRLAAAAPSMKAGLAAKVQSIEARLADFDTFMVLAGLGLMNHLLDPETYEEHTHKGESVVAEYATLLALKTSYSKGTELFPNSTALERLHTDLKAAFEETVWLQAAVSTSRVVESGRGSENPSELETLQFMMRTHELGVRNPAYEHHHHEVLEGLLRPFESTLVSTLGFSVDDAIRLADAIPRRINRRFNERLEEAARNIREIEDQAQKLRKSRSRHLHTNSVGQNDDERADHDVALQLSKLPPKQGKRILRGLAAEWTLLAASDICSFTAEELAEDVGMDVVRVAAYLRAFQINFGMVDADFVEISATHPLRLRPIVHHEGRYLSPAPMLLDWAIRPAFETALKAAGGPTWQRYHKHRHDWLLNKSVRLLERVMPSAVFATNLLYDQAGDRAKEAELDGLGLYDTIAFLVEAKGADVTEPARRGAPDSLRSDLNKVIRDSHAQAVRAKAHLTAGGEARFRRANGGQDVVTHSGEISEIMLLSVSLAPLGHLTALLHANSELGFFKRGEYSWVVSIYDLMVIAEIIDLPPMFPHYLKRRVHAAHMGVLQAHDELDIFGYYLAEGLYLDDVVEEMRVQSGGRDVSINLLSYTNPIDAYIFHSIGARKKPAPKPAQRMPSKLRSLLERLDRSGLPGRLEVALAVLNLDEESRKEFLRLVERARKISQREQRMSNGTMMGGDADRWGLTYVSGLDKRELQRVLGDYCARKQREFGIRTWFGFAERIGATAEIVAAVVIRA